VALGVPIRSVLLQLLPSSPCIASGRVRTNTNAPMLGATPVPPMPMVHLNSIPAAIHSLRFHRRSPLLSQDCRRQYSILLSLRAPQPAMLTFCATPWMLPIPQSSTAMPSTPPTVMPCTLNKKTRPTQETSSHQSAMTPRIIHRSQPRCPCRSGGG
jgi:hypothetical protein